MATHRIFDSLTLRLCVVLSAAWLAGPMYSQSALSPAENRTPEPAKIMAVGDSITAGADNFPSYRSALADQLERGGYIVQFVGTQTSMEKGSPLAHEGYGGKNTESLLKIVPASFQKYPADIVLLHSGHNHSVEERPIEGIVDATEALIAEFRRVNPRVTVLLAKVIPAGKLPKYEYIPDLNVALEKLAARLDRVEQRVILVDQQSGFDWRTDTIDDKVHPNAAGAEKISAKWFEALSGILKPGPNH